MRIAIAICAALVMLGGCGSDCDETANISSRATTSTSAVEETTTSSALPEETTTTSAAAAAPATTRAPSARAASPPTTARPSATPAPTSPPPQPGTTAAPSPPPPPPPAAPDINIQNFTFNPPALNAAVGKSVMVKNLDAATHTWTADDNSWNSNNLATDQTYSHTFTKAGTFAYHCAIHPSMKGTVNVR